MSQPETMVQPGDMLAGKYRVERVLGSGGMGTVIAATHLDLAEVRAIKLMNPVHAENAQAVERFLREARATARLKSEHIPRLYDVGRLESGAPYIVMEALEGSDLRTFLKNRVSLPVDEAVSYVIQACEAIAEAHAHGIIHRDLKPANLFLTTRDDGSSCLKVLDFGISKLIEQGPGGDMTKTLDVLGSIHYMAPEQLRSSRSVDARADIWSLGVILYRLVTGKLPFQGDTPIAHIMALREPLRAPSTFRSDLPQGLDAVIMSCLEKDPAKRIPSATELMAQLEPFAPNAGYDTYEHISSTPGAASLRPPPDFSELDAIVEREEAGATQPALPYGMAPGAMNLGGTQPMQPLARASSGGVNNAFSGAQPVMPSGPRPGYEAPERPTPPTIQEQRAPVQPWAQSNPGAQVARPPYMAAAPMTRGSPDQPLPSPPTTTAAQARTGAPHATQTHAARPPQARPQKSPTSGAAAKSPRPVSLPLFILLGCLIGAVAGMIIAMMIVTFRRDTPAGAHVTAPVVTAPPVPPAPPPVAQATLEPVAPPPAPPAPPVEAAAEPIDMAPIATIARPETPPAEKTAKADPPPPPAPRPTSATPKKPPAPPKPTSAPAPAPAPAPKNPGPIFE